MARRDKSLWSPDAIRLGIKLFGARTCTKCGQRLPANEDYFPVDSHQSDGLRKWCRRCRTAYERKYRSRNRSSDRRRCARCDAILASDNTDIYCSPCRRVVDDEMAAVTNGDRDVCSLVLRALWWTRGRDCYVNLLDELGLDAHEAEKAIRKLRRLGFVVQGAPVSERRTGGGYRIVDYRAPVSSDSRLPPCGRDHSRCHHSTAIEDGNSPVC